MVTPADILHLLQTAPVEVVVQFARECADRNRRPLDSVVLARIVGRAAEASCASEAVYAAYAVASHFFDDAAELEWQVWRLQELIV